VTRLATWRRLSTATILAAGATAAPASAEAADRPAPEIAAAAPGSSGMRVALRSGFAVPLGEAFAASGSLSSTIAGYVPLRLDVGYRLARHFYVGLAGQLAAIMSTGCPSGASCSGSNVRYGVMVAYHLLPSHRVDPWIGAGMGFEMLDVSRTVAGSRVDISARGLELLDVELGVDLQTTRALRIGPVLSSSLARYSTVSVNDTPTRDFDTALHAWVMGGLRGAFDL
jgi:opacity protein-like surface antigen